MRRELLKFAAKASFVFFLVIVTVALSSVIFYTAVVEPAESDVYEQTFSTEGIATRKVKPDTAVITIGTIQEGTNILELQKAANTKVNKTVEELKKLGIEDSKIQTHSYNITPVKDTKTGKITSYTVNVSMEVTVSVEKAEDNKVSDVIEKATASGLNEVRNLRFEIDEQEKMIEELELEAIENAKEEAKKKAEAAGLKLGDVKNINRGNYYPYYSYESRNLTDSVNARESAASGSQGSADSGGSVQVNPGEFELKARVTVIYELK